MAQTGPPGVDVTVKTIAPDLVQGRLAALSLRDGAVLVTDAGARQRIPTNDLVHIALATTASMRGSSDISLTLTGDDELYGRVDGIGEDEVIIDSADLGKVSVPLEAIVRLDTPRGSSAAYQEFVSWFDRKARDGEDRILLTNGDVVRGFVTAINREGVAIESDLGETLLPHRLVVAVRLAAAPPAPIKRPHMVIRLRSSGRLTVSDLNWSGDVAEARLRFGATVRLEARRIARVDVVGGRWEWLGEHHPISYEHTPMLSMDWEYVPDRNVRGGPITVAGKTFEHGVGVHSRSCLTYDLKNAYREFVTSFGIDDDSGPYADVSVFILVDGKPRFDQAHVRRGTLHGPIHLDVARAQRIELIVDFGDNGDLQDRFNWVAAALVR